MKLQLLRHGQRDYTKTCLFLPKKLVDGRRWQAGSTVYMSQNGPRKFALLAVRRFIDDIPVTLTAQHSKKNGEKYISMRIVIPQRIVTGLDLKKGDDASVTPFKGGMLIWL